MTHSPVCPRCGNETPLYTNSCVHCAFRFEEKGETTKEIGREGETHAIGYPRKII